MQALQRRSWPRSLLASLALCLALPCAAQSSDSYAARAQATAHAMLNDLSKRRRVAKLFPNHQSVFHGVQERFVNTSAGNLTFLVRDLVAVSAMPIVAGRVYDSALEKDEDFGPGWKLTLREEAIVRGDRLDFTDAGNSVYSFVIDGAAIKPVHPAATPVRSGEIAGATVVLRSHGLTRRFKKIDGVHRLTEASHATGWLRLKYRNGRIESAATANAEVRFERRADGRIVAARDSLGRSASYAYDAAGRLETVTDLAGAIWRHRYSAGGLEALEDPRGNNVLHVDYDRAGRVSWIEAQGTKSSFRYRRNKTRAVDGLNRTTEFHHAKSGATEGVESAAGIFSQLAFDAAGRPAEVRRDGARVATMEYDAEGRLASLHGPDGVTRFAHGAHGLLQAAGAQTARYRYDAAGRPTSASDAAGQRGYAYDASGFPARVEIDAWKTTLAHDANGQTTRVARDGRTVLEHDYAANGRVASIVHDGGALTAAYQYDQRGLRESASYGAACDRPCATTPPATWRATCWRRPAASKARSTNSATPTSCCASATAATSRGRTLPSATTRRFASSPWTPAPGTPPPPTTRWIG